MLKTILLIALTMIATGVFSQTPNTPPLSLEVAQQRARFARDQMNSAEEKVKAAEKKDQSAQKRLEGARAEADKTTKQLQDAQRAAVHAECVRYSRHMPVFSENTFWICSHSRRSTESGKWSRTDA